MNVQYIELGQAQQLVAAALRAAEVQGVPVTVAVTDPAGHLVALARMDGARYFAVEAATRKAMTAGGFRVPTHGLAEWAAKDAGFASAVVGSSTLTLLPGGLPVTLQGEVVGGLGIAGGTGEQDQAIGEAAIAALGSVQHKQA